MGKVINYQQKLDEILYNIDKENKVPTLLLHSCCAPCSSYVLEYLSKYFAITIYYYNPNISIFEEFQKRVNELQRLITCVNYRHPVRLVVGDYDPEAFYEIARGLENAPERGERCYKCYEIRLKAAARVCKEGNYDYYTTTLSISPHKNADWLNEIGVRIAKQEGVEYLLSDFKKKNGYKRSIELSKEYDLYRQDYCGCIYSKYEQQQRLLEVDKKNQNMTKST